MLPLLAKHRQPWSTNSRDSSSVEVYGGQAYLVLDARWMRSRQSLCTKTCHIVDRESIRVDHSSEVPQVRKSKATSCCLRASCKALCINTLASDFASEMPSSTSRRLPSRDIAARASYASGCVLESWAYSAACACMTAQARPLVDFPAALACCFANPTASCKNNCLPKNLSNCSDSNFCTLVAGSLPDLLEPMSQHSPDTAQPPDPKELAHQPCPLGDSRGLNPTSAAEHGPDVEMMS